MKHSICLGSQILRDLFVIHLNSIRLSCYLRSHGVQSRLETSKGSRLGKTFQQTDSPISTLVSTCSPLSVFSIPLGVHLSEKKTQETITEMLLQVEGSAMCSSSLSRDKSYQNKRQCPFTRHGMDSIQFVVNSKFIKILGCITVPAALLSSSINPSLKTWQNKHQHEPLDIPLQNDKGFAYPALPNGSHILRTRQFHQGIKHQTKTEAASNTLRPLA